MASVEFKVGDKVVYPAHGVGQISSIQKKLIGGSEHRFFEILITESGMRILVPMGQLEAVGLRRVADKKTIDKVYEVLRKKEVRRNTETWNRRHREYLRKIKAGSLIEMAEVLRDLSVIGKGKELSYGERKMLDTVQGLLVAELAIAKSRPEDRIRGELAQIIPIH